nr:immunoglobulin heavy chain junction region [Mus musculus]
CAREDYYVSAYDFDSW